MLAVTVTSAAPRALARVALARALPLAGVHVREWRVTTSPTSHCVVEEDFAQAGFRALRMVALLCIHCDSDCLHVNIAAEDRDAPEDVSRCDCLSCTIVYRLQAAQGTLWPRTSTRASKHDLVHYARLSARGSPGHRLQSSWWFVSLGECTGSKLQRPDTKILCILAVRSCQQTWARSHMLTLPRLRRSHRRLTA